MSYVVECLQTRLIAESVGAAGITFQNNVIITNTSTLVTDGTVTINNTTAAGAGTGALVITGGASIGGSLGGAGGNAINVNGANIRNGPTLLADFPNDSDYITRAAAETLASGLNVFPSTNVATIAPINTFVTPTTGANVITKSTNADINDDVDGGGGDDLFDGGVTLIVTDRILVKNDNRSATQSEPDDIINGIYEITDLGSAGTPWELTRVTMLEVGDNAFQAFTLVTDGDTQQGGYIQCNPAQPTTVGTDPLCFTLFSSAGGQNLESVLNTGNLTGANTIVIDTGSGGILSTAGTDLIVNAGTDDLLLSGDNTIITSTTNTSIVTVDITTTASGNSLENITGTSTTNAAGIVLDSSVALTTSGTIASMTADTGDLTLTSTAGTVNINDAVGGVSIDTGTNTITVNTADVVITAPLPQDIVGALNALLATADRQRVAHQLGTIPLISLDAFPTIKPMYWTWREARYGAAGMDYTTPILVFEVVTNSIDLHVRNNTAGVDLLAVTAFAPGFFAQALSNVPTADAEIFLEIRANLASNQGELRGVSLEWIAQNPV